MPSALTVFLIAALLCVTMLLVLRSFLRSGIAGVREWSIANLLACGAFILYAFGRELPPLIAYEVANGVYAAAGVPVFSVSIGVALLRDAEAFHDLMRRTDAALY